MEGVDGIYGQCSRWDGVWTVEGCLIRVIHTFNINPSFGGIRPATFASMGPNTNKRQRVKILKKLINPLFSPSENKVQK